VTESQIAARRRAADPGQEQPRHPGTDGEQVMRQLRVSLPDRGNVYASRIFYLKNIKL
jgi:hypothetical protein